jgi:hypothetical protein
MPHPDLPAEQAYVDRAYAALDDMRDLVGRAANATDQEVAALALEAWSARRLATYEDAERGLLFGRLAARPFYTATPHDPQRVTRRRRFRCNRRRRAELLVPQAAGERARGEVHEQVRHRDREREHCGAEREPCGAGASPQGACERHKRRDREQRRDREREHAAGAARLVE